MPRHSSTTTTLLLTNMGPKKVTSFRKVVVNESKSVINGTKASPQNFSLLVSSGVSALDSLLGGGLPVGSLLLLEEDEFNHYANSVVKCFLSEGILCKQRVFFASRDVDARKLIDSLPGVATTENIPSDTKPSNDSSEMQIAWRYENLKVADSTIGDTCDFGHKLDLSTKLSEKVVRDAEINVWPTDTNCHVDEDFMPSLINVLREENHCMDGSQEGKQVVRVAITNLGSPIWDESNIAKILYNLRSWLRRSVAVGLVSIPSHLHKEGSWLSRWMHFSDICIRLDSFAGTSHASNPALKEFHGLLHIRKLAAFNSIAPHQPLSDLAFKLRRRKLVIERFCLPPELEDTTARGHVDASSVGCGSAKSQKLDF